MCSWKQSDEVSELGLREPGRPRSCWSLSSVGGRGSELCTVHTVPSRCHPGLQQLPGEARTRDLLFPLVNFVGFHLLLASQKVCGSLLMPVPRGASAVTVGINIKELF